MALLADLLGENAGGPGNALGFRFYGLEPVITVLASKTSRECNVNAVKVPGLTHDRVLFYNWLVVFLQFAERYRLQCDEFDAMWLLLNELVNRLYAHFSSYGQKDFSVSYDGPLPLQEYFDVLDVHFEVCTLLGIVAYSEK